MFSIDNSGIISTHSLPISFLFGYEDPRFRNNIWKWVQHKSRILFLISSDPTDTINLRKIRISIGETFCRNDPSPLHSILAPLKPFSALIRSPGGPHVHWSEFLPKSKCVYSGRCWSIWTKFPFRPLLLIFPSRPPSLVYILQLILGASYPLTTTFSFRSSPWVFCPLISSPVTDQISLQSAPPCGSRVESRSSISELPLQHWHSKSSFYTHGTIS